MSYAQTLPFIILERIVDYVLEFHPLPGLTSSSKCDLCIAELALPGVCKHWRKVSLTHLYKSVSWNTVKNIRGDCKASRFLSNKFMNAIKNEGAGVVKSFTVACRRDTILDGSYVKELGMLPSTCKVLPGVSILDLSILSSSDETDIDLDESKDNILSFCAAIRRMFPNVGKLKITGSTRRIQPKDDELLDTITCRLVNPGIPAASAESHVKFSRPFSSLQYLNGSISGHNSPVIELARRHASSLEFLAIRTAIPEAISRICYRSSGEGLVYSRLKVFSIFPGGSEIHFDTKYKFQEVRHVPFPVLCTVNSISPYPFAGDVVFRGNTETLSKFTVLLTRHNLDTFLTNSVLKRERLMALDVAEYMYFGPATGTMPTSDMLRAALPAESTMKMFKFDTVHPIRFESVWPSLETIGARMESLRIRSLACTLEQVISLVNVLPLIKTLEFECVSTPSLMGTDRLHDECEGACRLASHPAEPSGKPRHVRFMETHLDCICSDMAVAEALYMQHYPLSLSLKNFYVGTRGSNLMLASRMVVLMSLLCPRIGLYDLCGQPAYDSLGQRLEQSRLESTRQRASHA